MRVFVVSGFCVLSVAEPGQGHVGGPGKRGGRGELRPSGEEETQTAVSGHLQRVSRSPQHFPSLWSVSRFACGHCQSVGVCSLSVCWRVVTVSQSACVHCQSVGVCSLSVCWRVFIVSQLACVHCQSVRVCSLSVSWRVYTASLLAHVHSQRVSVSSRVFTVDRHGEPGEGSPSDGQSVLIAPSLSDLCLCGQHGYGTKEKDSPSEDQLVLTTLYLCVDCRYNEPGANHSSSIHLQRVS